jgi:hypothetical protein
VLDHLLHHASSRGAVAVVGRVMPRFLQAICDQNCLILRRSTYVLVHSRDPEITEAFVNGRAFLSLLDGEGPLQIWNNSQLALRRIKPTTSIAKNDLTKPGEPDFAEAASSHL